MHIQGNVLGGSSLWDIDAGVVAIAALVWFVGSSLSALGSGWHKLAIRFRHRGDFEGDVRRFQTGVMRWASRYNYSLVLGANQEGLYIRTMWLARMEHPPLFIPWSEVTAIDQPRRFREGTLLTLGRKEQVPLWVLRRTGDWLRQYMPSAGEIVEKFYSQREDVDRAD
ncbi:MAG TPA: hypothetical protein VMD58_10275 [Acidobacteriaceae bacterium]|nr:hypothetical protein [Acidobacteriaceae bacterium]